MHWLVDGYNVIRRAPELAARERESLEAGRQALCRLLSTAARASGQRFTVVFDGRRGGGSSPAGEGVRVVFSSARESADRVLAQLAARGTAVVSNDREVREAAGRAGASAVTADDFLRRLKQLTAPGPPGKDHDDDEPRRGPKKGNPRRLPKRERATRRSLGRLG